MRQLNSTTSNVFNLYTYFVYKTSNLWKYAPFNEQIHTVYWELSTFRIRSWCSSSGLTLPWLKSALSPGSKIHHSPFPYPIIGEL